MIGGRTEIAHGGRLEEARRDFIGAPEPFIDLSTGINPVPYPFACLPAEAFTRLPEPGALAGLQAVAGRAYGVGDPAMVVAAPGTQILINLLPRLFPMRGVAVLGPTYAEHAACWRAGGAAVGEVGNFSELGRHPGAVLCNPNNPDGRRVAPGDLLGLARRVRLLVVDESFADLEGGGLSLAPSLGEPGVVVLRSFGKSFGLAGVRLGFALAAAGTAAAIRAALGPWAVSGVAIRIGCEALADAGWLAATRRRLDGDVGRLDGLLAAAGCRVVGGTRLFRLVEAGDGAGLYRRLGRRGIFVRRFVDRPGLLRFGLPAPAEWKRVAAALG